MNSKYLTPEFKGVFDKPFGYRQSKKIAGNHRELNVLTEEDFTAESYSRELFAAAYRKGKVSACRVPLMVSKPRITEQLAWFYSGSMTSCGESSRSA